MYQIKPSEIYFNSGIHLSVIYAYDLRKCLWFLSFGNTYWYMYICIYIYILIHFFIQNSPWLLHRYLDNSAILHWQWRCPQGYWRKKTDSSTNQAELNTTKRKPRARCLWHTVIRIGVSDHIAFHWDCTRYKRNGTYVNEPFSNADLCSHTYIHTPKLCKTNEMHI